MSVDRIQAHPTQAAGGTVLVLAADGSARAPDHMSATRADLARRIAGLLGYRYGGESEPDPLADGRRYYVPAQTLLAAEASDLGIGGELDLFGGVVPHAFLTTKVISHPVVDAEARVPDGWSHDVCRAMGDAVLPGYSAFSPADARRAGRLLLGHGVVRVKLASGIGGSDQATVASADELDAVLAGMAVSDVLEHGVVLEQNLADAVTYSIGQLRLGDWTLAYHGTQHLTRDHEGRQVYGGSDLLFTPGGFDALLALPLSPEQRAAVGQAIHYDAAVNRAYPEFFASRRNYDVAAGHGAGGARRCGVLEQSWRIGGATPAELAALAAFRADPSLRRVRASCHERYTGEPPPAGATVHYRGDDGETGMLCKYSLVEEEHRA